MGAFITVPFHGTDLLAITTEAGPPLVPLPPLVEGMGLDWSAQLQRLKRDPILARSMVMMTMESGREAWCLPLRRIPGFLFKVDTRRIADPGIRAKVLDFQDGAYDALADACLGPEAPRRAAERVEVAQPITGSSFTESHQLVAEARQTFGRQPARELWFKLGPPVVPTMRAPAKADPQGALFTYTATKTGERA